jgi:hypothetical protein
MRELEGIFEASGLSSPFASLRKDETSQLSQINIKELPQLVQAPRFRLLREHYYAHASRLDTNRQATNSKEMELSLLHIKIASLEKEATQYGPLFNEIQERDMQLYTEMHIIAKERARRNEHSTQIKPKTPPVIKEKPAKVPNAEKMEQFRLKSIERVHLLTR